LVFDYVVDARVHLFVVFVTVVVVIVVVTVTVAVDFVTTVGTARDRRTAVAVVHFLFEVQQVFNRVPDAPSGPLFTSDGRPRAFAAGIPAAATTATATRALSAAVLLLT